MEQIIAMVREFHVKVGAPSPVFPSVNSLRDSRLRVDFVAEELEELESALSVADDVDTLDALCDLLYLVIGTAVATGLSHALPAAFAEVHRSNMTKTANGDGKALKGPDYSPPDLRHLL